MEQLLFSILFLLCSISSWAQQWYPCNFQATGNMGIINDMETFQGKLHFAGNTDTIAGIFADGLFSWDGVVIDTLGGSTGNIMRSISANDSVLLIGGSFNNWMGLGMDNVMTWDGTQYDFVAGTFFTPFSGIEDVLVNDEDFYFADRVSGTWPLLNSRYVGTYSTIDGWSDMNTGVSPVGFGITRVDELIIYNNELVICGQFQYVGNPDFSAKNIASWDGTRWDRLGSGLISSASQMTVDTMNNFLYVAGSFIYAGGEPANHLARWDGYSWRKMKGFEGWVINEAMTMYQNELFVGGVSQSTGDLMEEKIKRFDGDSWLSVNGGTNENLECFHVYDDTLWVAGGFDTVGVGVQNLPSWRIAKWWMPSNTHCNWLQPVIHVNEDQTIQVGDTVPFYNNNSYADSWNWSVDGIEMDSIINPNYSFSTAGSHVVQIIVEQDGCIDTVGQTIWVEPVLEMNDFSKIQFSAYPNPSNGLIQIEYSSGLEIENLVVTDIVGNVVKSVNLNSKEGRVNLDLSNQNSGIYFCSLVSDSNKLSSTKLILAR